MYDLLFRNALLLDGRGSPAKRGDLAVQKARIAAVGEVGAAVNIAAFVGHSSVRSYVMGDAATERVATKGEVQRMRALVLEALRAGAIGFATSTSPAHNGAEGRPMPSRLADDAELAALVGALGEHGRGLFMLTKGGHTRMEFLERLSADYP